MVSTSTKGLALLVIFLMMLSAVEGANWQGSGNITKDHLNFFWNYINANFSGPATNRQFGPFCEQFSTALNLKWDPAWNVAVTVGDSLKDSVLYGYAYNDHWYQYNGYKSGSLYYAILIWKDYNCQGWQTIDGTQSSGFDSSRKSQIVATIQEQSAKYDINIWNIADDFMTSLKSKSFFPETKVGLSLVISSHANSIWARICVVGTNFYSISGDYGGRAIGTSPTSWGNLLVFQTR